MTRARNSANLASHGNLFVDITNDRTGIGSVVPDQNLHVAGTAGFHADVTFTGDLYNTSWDRSDNSLKFVDNAMAKFGDSGDLMIYHHPTNGSIINHFGNNHLVLRSGNRIDFRSANDDTYFARFVEDGSAEIYYDGNEKIRTTNEGALVTGILTATSFSGPIVGNTSNSSGVSTFYDVRVTNNLTVEGTTTTLDTNLIGVDRIEVGADSNTIVGVAVTQSGTADIINLFDGTTEVLTVKDGGFVGIGTDDPQEILHIHKSGTGPTDVRISNSEGYGFIRY